MDLAQHLLRSMAFGHATFGPGARTDGVSKHIRKELLEIARASDTTERAEEWVDVVILALDGLTRELAYGATGKRESPVFVAQLAVSMILEKQAINEARDWPDWRTVPADAPIEHVRAETTV